MSLIVSKWGNSLGIRIPAQIISALSIKNGDCIEYELDGYTIILHKKPTTKQLFEDFYGKSFSEITPEDMGVASEIDYGNDIGNEVV